MTLRRAARPARRHRARPRDRPAPPGDVRLHARGRPDAREPDGRRGDGADRLDGDRHPARRPLREAAAPLRLLQAALRPGDQPARRRRPREIVMAVDTAIGPEENLLEPTPKAARHFELTTPVLLNAELEKIRALDGKPGSRGFRSITLPMLFKVQDGGAGLRKAIEDLRRRTSEAIAEGHNVLILSDRGHDATDAPIPALLALVVRPAPPPPRGVADPRRPRRRVGRAARGPPLLPPDRLRRERDQPVPRLRDDPRPGPARDALREPPRRPRSATSRPSTRGS